MGRKRNFEKIQKRRLQDYQPIKQLFQLEVNGFLLCLKKSGILHIILDINEKER